MPHTNTDTHDPTYRPRHYHDATEVTPGPATLVFPDGSAYTLSETHLAALRRKYGPGRLGEWHRAAISDTAQHYQNRTEPTRYGTAVAWGQSDHDASKPSYPHMAALAPVVIYPDLRAGLLQIALERLDGDDSTDVITLSPDGQRRSYADPDTPAVDTEGDHE